MMRWGLIIVGLLFFSNPNIGIFDFLPDVIGFLLIIKGLGYSPLVIPYWREASSGLIKMVVISTLKLICIPLLWKNISSLPILLSFSFAIVELVFIIPLFNKFFEGLFYVGMRYNGNSILAYKEKDSIITDVSNGKKILSKVRSEKGPKVRNATYFFLIFRAAISIIPNISDLQLINNSGEVTDRFAFRLADFNDLLSLFTFLIGCIGAAIWLVYIIPYLLRIKNDKQLQASFDPVINKLSSDTVISTSFNMHRVCVLYSIALCLSILFLIEGTNYILSLIPSIFLLIVSLLTSKFNKKSLFAFFPLIVCSAASIMEFIYRYDFFVTRNYDPEATLWSMVAKSIYINIEIFTVIDRLALLAVILFEFYIIKKKWKSDYSIFCSSHDLFFTDKIKKMSIKWIIITIITTLLFTLSAVEPFIVLYIEFASTLITLLMIAWAVFTVLSIADVLVEEYPL